VLSQTQTLSVAIHSTESNSNTFSRYTLNGSPLSNRTLASDVGVFTVSNLTFKQHICTVNAEAQKGLLKERRTLYIVHKTFIIYIRPRLEY